MFPVTQKLRNMKAWLENMADGNTSLKKKTLYRSHDMVWYVLDKGGDCNIIIIISIIIDLIEKFTRLEAAEKFSYISRPFKQKHGRGVHGKPLQTR